MYDVLLAASAMFAQSLSAQPAIDADANSQEDSWRAETITVTAQPNSYQTEQAAVTKQDTPLREVAQSIQVITPALLEDQQITDLAQALRNVSGVTPSLPSEIVLANPVVRGFEAEYYIDGLLSYGDTAVVDPATTAIVERIEVAKGPSSVLFGGGSGAPVGGLINVVTKAPEDQAFVDAALRLGSFSTVAPQLDINQPLGDRAAIRLPVEYLKSDDAIDEVEIERLSAAPSARFYLGDHTELLLRMQYNRIEQLEYPGLPAALADRDDVDPFQFTGARDTPPTEIENTSIQLTVDHDFSASLAGTFHLRRFDNEFDEFAATPFFAFFPIDDTAAPLIKGSLPVDTAQWTADANLRWRVDTGAIAHQIIAGLTWDDTNYQAASGFDFTPIGVYDYVSETPQLSFGQTPPLNRFLENDYRTLALYVQDHLRFGSRWSAQIGGRLSRYELVEVTGGQGTDERYTRFDPRLGLAVDLNDALAAYAAWAKGSRLSLFFAGADGAPPRLETSEAYELGLKLQSNPLGLAGTLAVFQIDRSNVPTPDPTTFVTSIQTGEQRARGVELDLVWEPTSQLSLLLAAARTDSEVTQDTVIPSGNGIPRVPEHSGRLAAHYRFEGRLSGLSVGGGLSWAGDAEITLPNAFSTDSYQVGDLQMSYQWRQYRLGLKIENVTDHDYTVPYQYFAQSVVRPGNPRSAFVTLSASF